MKELELDTTDVVINSFATAQAVLDKQQKQLGALVIDIGGGTTDFLVYVDGAVKQSGVLAVGGDHITNDMCIGLKIPTTRAEKLKVEEGSVMLGTAFPGETILLRDETGFAGREIERELVNQIVHLASVKFWRSFAAWSMRNKISIISGQAFCSREDRVKLAGWRILPPRFLACRLE